MKVIGAGFGRTGTLSLKLALEQLGFGGCYHMVELFAHPDHLERWRDAVRGRPVPWDRVFEGYQSTVDWPSCTFWEAQAAHFPEARVILSERDPERWYDSVMNTIYPSCVAQRDSADPWMREWISVVYEIIWDGTFGGRIEDRAHAIRVFREHNERVRASVPASRLLVFDAAEGWEPLCRFLECEVPADPYPRVNTTADFQTQSGAAAPGH